MCVVCRFVRQESPLWAALHNGVLTSGTLNGALGFYEPGAVQRLGLPKHFARHGALQAAYSNLLQPEYVPPVQVCWSCFATSCFSGHVLRDTGQRSLAAQP